MNNHQRFMQRCYELAELAAREGESPVGSVIVKDGVIIGEAYEKSRQLKDITRHAETLAILDARQRGRNLEGVTMYTNVEPCILCSYVIRHHKIGHVVFVKYSGELGGTVEPFNVLTASCFNSWGLPPVITQVSERGL
ncbi:nucleoside deaminase [Fulvivirgaceae bacterium PWU5]|uniref:Nucleoside deaminase n=1 Tax=Dawidia cretensis TaxID=2782350 RepID=A0AAP2DXZ7_9BACT|nr:nucleoside deaminase [Dawidia cretensis]MBT1707839.1 nucleoside deaminase [Dawidia cretensis]